MEEIWKDIEGYEGLYQVSNLGRIRSMSRKVNSPIRNSKELKKRTVKGQIIKRYLSKSGYLTVSLWKNNKKHPSFVHRLVAEAFISNPENKPCVNHKDYNRQNASADNLEWVTYKENVQYSLKALSEAHIGKASTPNKLGQMYIHKTPCGHYGFVIERLGINKTYHTIEEAIKAREVIIGW